MAGRGSDVRVFAGCSAQVSTGQRITPPCARLSACAGKAGKQQLLKAASGHGAAHRTLSLHSARAPRG